MRAAASVIAVAFVLLSCGTSEKPLSEAGEKVYPLKGTILGRDAGDNTLKIDHDAIPGYMEAMTMDYSVRGAKVTALPANGTRIESTLHVTETGYWITDVRKAAQ